MATVPHKMMTKSVCSFELTILWCCYGDGLAKGARSRAGNSCHSERVVIVRMKFSYIQRSSCCGIDDKAGLCIGDGDIYEVGDDDAIMSFNGWF